MGFRKVELRKLVAALVLPALQHRHIESRQVYIGHGSFAILGMDEADYKERKKQSKNRQD